MVTDQVRTWMQAARHGFRFGNRFVYTWLWGRVNIVYGLCGGMCFASLDYAYAGIPLPQASEPPAWGAPLQRYLLRRQWDSWRWLTTPLRAVWWMLQPQGQLVRRTLARELPKVLAGLDANVPQALLLLRARGADPTVNHIVAATGYQRDGQGAVVTLFLYDPNHPGREVCLWVDASAVACPPISQSTGEPLQGFVCIGYRPRTPGPQNRIAM